MAAKKKPSAPKTPAVYVPLTATQKKVLKREVASSVPKDWPDDFLNRNGVSPALGRVAEIDKSRDKWLLSWVVRTCYQADTFDDEAKRRRAIDSDLLRKKDGELTDHRKDIDKVRRFLKRRPMHSDLALASAILQVKDRLFFYSADGKKSPPSELLDQLLAAYANQLEIGTKTGLLYRYQVGPLIYPEPFDTHAKSPDAKANGLIFSLAFLFRHATAAKGAVFDEGMPMPTFGEPHCELIAIFAEALNIKMKSNSIGPTINKLSKLGVTLSRWP